MFPLLIAILAGAAFVVAYFTYGRWLGRSVFKLDPSRPTPAHTQRDGHDYVPTKRSIVFGHHFTSIAGTGPIVGPAIAVMWGWLPALLWVVLGSIFIGAVHDFGALVVSLRNKGQTVGQIAGKVINRRVRTLFLLVLFLALTIVLAIFGLVIAAVFKQYPQTITPCLVQIPLAVAIGVWLHRRGADLKLPSLLALGIMYATVIFGDVGVLGVFNQWAKGLPIIAWCGVLLIYSAVASVLPVWSLLQPRDFINSLQLLSALGLIVVGLVVAAFVGGAPPIPGVEGADRPSLEIVAPMVDFEPAGAPLLFPFLFITIACGAISGFHCLVSSGTSSKQLESEGHARFVGYGGMLTEGFLATLVILACVAGLGLGVGPSLIQSGIASAPDGFWLDPDREAEKRQAVSFSVNADADVIPAGPVAMVYSPVPEANGFDFEFRPQVADPAAYSQLLDEHDLHFDATTELAAATGPTAFLTRYHSWSSAGGLGAKVGAFVDGAANFLKAMGIPAEWAVALMGVLVASFAGTTLDTATRLQRYVVQELFNGWRRPVDPEAVPCWRCGYDVRALALGAVCPECGEPEPRKPRPAAADHAGMSGVWALLGNKYAATLIAVVVAFAMAAMPKPGVDWSWQSAGAGGLILWPMFGATNQLLGGLAFLVIGFWLWRRRRPVWFLVVPLGFMLVMPAWALVWQLFIGSDGFPAWVFSEAPNWPLIAIAVATLALEVWMIVEAALLWPRVRGVLDEHGEELRAAVDAAQ
ncbi:MAG: carbon starvation CstA family protein [Planctomycetota bacterium]